MEATRVLAPEGDVNIVAQNLEIKPSELFAREAFNSERLTYDNSQNLLLLSDINVENGNLNITATDTAFLRAATLRVGGTPDDPDSGNIRIHAGELMIDRPKQSNRTEKFSDFKN